MKKTAPPDSLVFPHKIAWDLRPYLTSLFEKWRVTLLDGPCEYRMHTSDFGIETKQLLMAQEINNRVINPTKSALAKKMIWDGFTFLHTSQNMVVIAERLGIDLQRTDTFYCVRDPYIRLIDGTGKTAYHSSYSNVAIERTHSGNLYLNKTAATHTKNQFFNSWSGFTQTVSKRVETETKKIYKKEPDSFAYTYVEGGNVWTMTNRAGDIKVCVGSDHLIQSLHIHNLEQRSWEELATALPRGLSFAALKAEIAPTLSVEEIRNSAEEMFAQGLFLQNGKSGLIDRKQQLNIMMIKFMTGNLVSSDEETDWFRKIAVKRGTIEQFDLKEAYIEKSRPLVAEYLAKKAITHELMALDFGISLQDLHFINQVIYHLDLFIRPGPAHSVFITNFAICVELLESLAAAKAALKLSESDMAHLERYIETAKKMDLEIGPGLLKVKSRLEEAGFTVIPLPCNFMYESKTMYQEFPLPSGGYNINFINALTGWSSRTGHYYYITHGVQVGDHLGDLLMDAYTVFLQEYIPDIELYFIGRNPANLSDFSEAMDWWNRLETQIGIHCTTFELATHSHF